ncbi:hypothetical protein [Stenotrophomonas sp.]|uniref:hypothetical protein n=1 Tax=Stenotrophomonas sp. TaxID=69392 RepID=UPI00289F51C6|nr:hypothetical protein [Stenotrophomonas sp.]
MSVREPKSTQYTTIQIKDRNGNRKGRLELSSGNLIYFRKSASKESLSITYQDLTALLEAEIEYRSIDKRGPLPKGGKDDFYFQAFEHPSAKDAGTIFDVPELAFEGSCGLSRMDSRRVEDGMYSLISQNASTKPSRRSWYASVSVPMAISIIAWYIDKFLAGKKAKTNSKSIALTKDQMRRVLYQLIKRMDS